MVLLPEEAEMTLAELRQMAANQQRQIEMQQQLLIVKEQRLKFLKQQEARHHLEEKNTESTYLQNLREEVESQELKLRKLRALHGQVEQQKANNCNLAAELESVRALFSEKEKELSIAVSKVEELTRQLNDVRKCSSRKPTINPLGMNDLENLRRELMYRSKLTEQQNQHISQQRNLISEKQQDIYQLDEKISELTQRLRRKRLMNQQLANQIHNAALARHSANSRANTHSSINIATVEPIQRDLSDIEQTRDDLAAKLHSIHQSDFYDFSLKKNDPKYQTLPYNTKFYLKGKTNQDDNSQMEDDLSDSTPDSHSSSTTEIKINSDVSNLVPRPFNNSTVNNNVSGVEGPQQPTQKVAPFKPFNSNQTTSSVLEKPENPVLNDNHQKSDIIDSSTSTEKNTPTKNAQIKTFNGKVQLPADYKKTKEKFSGAVVKPVVPPKPTFPVKPVPPPRQTPTKDNNASEEKNDVVAKAISMLQSKSSDKEKAAFSNYKERLLYYRYVSRYNFPKSTNNNDGTSSEPKVSTYFPVVSLSSEVKATISNFENIKKKPWNGQLPIKPKPLTIRKTPGLEPPRLKIQQNSNAISQRKPQEINPLSSSSFKPIVSPFLIEQSKKTEVQPMQEIIKNSVDDVLEIVPKPNVVKEKHNISLNKDDDKKLESDIQEQIKKEEMKLNDLKISDADDSEGSSSSPCDSLECVPIHNNSENSKCDSVNGKQEVVINHTATCHKVKGNLKTEASVRSPRRVSFDPLALLLDAALEGELELVKKTTQEVPNPSAANDEGITALHNSICAGHFDVVTFLVEFGCDVNAQDSDGWTPLHCAASCNNLPMVEFLVERGACIFATTLSDHETAAEKCEEDDEGFDSCSEYLYGLQKNLGRVNNGIVYAVYDYEGQNADELSFKDGDAVTVLRNGDEQEKEWWWAKLNDEEGYIPRNLLGLYPRMTIKRE